MIIYSYSFAISLYSALAIHIRTQKTRAVNLLALWPWDCQVRRQVTPASYRRRHSRLVRILIFSYWSFSGFNVNRTNSKCYVNNPIKCKFLPLQALPKTKIGKIWRKTKVEALLSAIFFVDYVSAPHRNKHRHSNCLWISMECRWW